MNEQDYLELSWTVAKDTPSKEEGFKGSLEDYKDSLNDPENLKKAFNQAKAENYSGNEITGFAKMLGVDMEVLGEGKSNGVVAEDATVAPEMQASENTVSESENTSLGLEEPEEYSYFGDLGKKITANTYRALATISEIPNYLNSVKGAIDREFMSDEERKRYDALDPVVQDAINNIDGISFLPGISGSSMPALAMELSLIHI